MRLVLENVGVSLAVASLWFFGMPLWVQWGRGGGTVVRVRRNLVLGAVILFGLSLWLTFSLRPSQPQTLLVWHVGSMAISFLGFWAITVWAPRAFDSGLLRVLLPVVVVPVLGTFVSFISHGLRVLALLWSAQGALR